MTSGNEETTTNESTTLRVEALREAARIISGERNKQYGGPEENFERIAKIWEIIFVVSWSLLAYFWP